MIEKDHTQSLEIAALMKDAVRRMHESVNDTGAALKLIRQATKYQEHLLAKYIRLTNTLDGRGKSRSRQDRADEAMTNPDYLAEFQVIDDGLKEAFQLQKQWEVNDKAFEGNRSMLSLSKKFHDDLQG